MLKISFTRIKQEWRYDRYQNVLAGFWYHLKSLAEKQNGQAPQIPRAVANSGKPGYQQEVEQLVAAA